MSLTSPQGNLYQQLVNRIKTAAAAFRYINQDLGQLEHYNMRPAVTWPCVLIDIAETQFSNMQNDTTQMAEGMILIRTGVVQYGDTSNLSSEQWQEKALQFYEDEQQLNEALHGWAPVGFSKLLRVSVSTERREDDIRVRVSAFSYSYTDETAKKKKVTITRPDPTQLL